MSTASFFQASSVALLLASVAVSACSSPSGEGGGLPSRTESSVVSSSNASSSSSSSSSAEPTQPSTLAAFDITKGQMPEGLAVNATHDTAYVGFASTGKVAKVAIATGAVTDYGSVPAPPANGGLVLGLALDGSENLYVGVASFTASYAPGIYRITKGGGSGTLYASDPSLVFPNGLLLLDGGAMLVADSTGVVFKVAADKTVTTWAKDPMLASDKTSPCALGMGIGANGIALQDGVVYVSNTDNASVLKIPMNADGTAGAVSTFMAPDCSRLKGADGLVAGANHALYLAANAQDTVLRLGSDASVSVVAKGSPLDFPASPVVVTSAHGSALYVSNLAYLSAQTDGGVPKPSVVSIPLGN